MKTLKQFQENTRAYKEYTRLSGVTPEQRARQMDDVHAKIEQQRKDFEADMAAQKNKMSAIKNKHHTQDHMKEEVEELDEALRHEIAGQVARFIGNKIDPVHGDIMHAHGKEAYRQAAYHIRKTIHHESRAISDLHDNLHHHLKTGTPIKLKLGEEVEELDEARYSKYKQDTYTRPNMRDNYADFAHLGMNSDVPASKSEFKKKELKFELRKEPKKVKEEASPMIKAPKNEFATKADAFAHAKEKGGKVMKKTFTHPTTGQQHVSYVVKEEVELDEEQMYYSLVHKTTKKVLSTHKDMASAKDEHRGMDHGVQPHYYIATSKKEPKTFNMKEATYQGKDVPLNKPMAGDVKKSKVYVDPDGDGKAQKVNFGDKTMSIKKDQPGRKKSFLARHNCDDKNDKTKAGYWSCKAWK